MKKSKKILSGILSLMMIFSSAFVLNAAGDTVETRKISLWDLSGLEVGSADLPDGAEYFSDGLGVGAYSGTKAVADDGFKISFDKENTVANNGGNLSDTKIVAVRAAIPDVYAPYITAVDMNVENTANSLIRYEFGLSDGTTYSKRFESNPGVPANGATNASFGTASLKQIAANGVCWWRGGSSSWESNVKSAKYVFLVLGAPACTGEEGYYALIKDIGITVTGTKDELDAAEAAAAEAWKNLYDFENGIGGITSPGTIALTDDGAYVASGEKALSFISSATAEYQDKWLNIPINANVKKATGISFWIYNTGENNVTFVCMLRGADDYIASQSIIAPAGSYVKVQLDFSNMKTATLGINGDYTNWQAVAKSLTADEIASITRLDLRPTNAVNHPGYYFDDFRYEKNTAAYTKTIPITSENVTVSGTGASSTEISGGAITYTPANTASTVSADTRVVANEVVTSIAVDSGFFDGASQISFDVTSTLGNTIWYGIVLRGTKDSGVVEYWKWGAKWFTSGCAANKTNCVMIRSFDGSSGGGSLGGVNESSDRTCFACPSTPNNDYFYTSNQAYRLTNSVPTASEKNSINTLEFRLSNFFGTGTFTINSITVSYTGNKIAADSGISGGSVSFEKSWVFTGDKVGFTLVPESGNAYKLGTLKITTADGKDITPETRYGFRETSLGYYTVIDMPAADVTVSAEFEPAQTFSYTASADEDTKSLVFDIAVAAKNGKVKIDESLYEIVSVGALVTTDSLLTAYYGDNGWDILSKELAASDDYIAGAIEDICVKMDGSSGLLYDKAREFIRFNVILNNLSKKSRAEDFVVKEYVEYKDADGNTQIIYGDGYTESYNALLFGADSDNAQMAKGISYSGVFETAIADVSATNKIFDKATFTDIADQGFDHVRLTVNFSANTDDTTDAYTIDSALFNALDVVIKNAMQSGLTVVLDFHNVCKLSDTETLYTSPSTVSPKFIAIWQQVAEHYADYPDRLVFELINEPTVSESFTTNQLMELQETVLEDIRAISPTRKVTVTVRLANSAYHLDDISDTLKNDKNVIASIHSYSPMEFTHQKASWIKNSDGTLTYPDNVAYTSTTADLIKNEIGLCEEFEAKTGMQVWLGEFGVLQNTGVAASDVKSYLNDVVTACGEDIGWCCWEYNQGFGAYSSSGWKENVMQGLGLWQ